MLVTINEGAEVLQLGCSWQWPECFPPDHEYFHDEYKNVTKFPKAVFIAEWGDTHWKCTRFGYGQKGLSSRSQGYGEICVVGLEGITEVKSVEI